MIITIKKGILQTQGGETVDNVTIITAFLAGFASFLSPCLLPLVPAYIMYMTGDLSSDDPKLRRRKAVVRTLGFVLGFTTIFMLLGISATALGQVFNRNRLLFMQISGVVIMLFGIHMTGLVKIPWLYREKRAKAPSSIKSWMGSVLMGMAFSAGWTPCFGPILAIILTSTAATSSNVAQGAFYLFVYSMGMAVPFILTSLFINTFEKLMDKYAKHARKVQIIAGFILIVFGYLIFSNNVIKISTWLL